MTTAPRTDWTLDEVKALWELPFNDLLFKAQSVHRENFDPHEVQISTLLSIKTGACPEDCSYCPQSVRFDTNVEEEPLLDCRVVIENAKAAKAKGATRFCMGAAYRSPKPKQVKQIAEMIRAVNELGMETCATLGMLTPEAAAELKEAGLDYYNHNIDSSENFYKKIITTRTFQHRLDTLKNVRDVGMKICCGGIIGMGEEEQDRIELLHTLATMPEHPGSVPINQLVQVKGTPLDGVAKIDGIDFVRTIAVARILMPQTHVRLSAGRTEMSDETQAMCFFAGANSIFYGEKLLTTGNPEADKDLALMQRLGMRPEAATKGKLVDEQRKTA
jgi:biotin synthase